MVERFGLFGYAFARVEPRTDVDRTTGRVAITLAADPQRRVYVRRINGQPALVSAQSLWLAARIENRLGNQTGAQELGRQLRARFGSSREAMAFERGQFNE